jgi:hypothetical protein
MSAFELIRILALVLTEIAVGVVVCAVMSRIAGADNRSPIVWSIITVAFCIGSVAIPVPFVRLVVAGDAVFAAMFFANLIRLPSL